MGIFGKSFSRELGKNTGKYVSNRVFGNGYATLHKIIRKNRAASSKIRKQKAELELKYTNDQSKIKLERDRLELKEEKKRLRIERRELKLQLAKGKLNGGGGKAEYYFSTVIAYFDRPWKFILAGYMF